MLMVFDSDGLIKVVKSGIGTKLVKKIGGLISRSVWKETVEKGKEKGHADALAIEEMVKEGLLKVVEDAENNEAARMVSESSGIGRGESSALGLFFNRKADAIVSDDRAFLSVLEANGVPFLTPSVLIAAAVDSKIIGKPEGIAAIEKLNADRIIRYEDYLEAKQELEGK